MDSTDCKQICKEWSNSNKKTSSDSDIDCDKICVEITKSVEKIKRDEEITGELAEYFIFHN